MEPPWLVKSLKFLDGNLDQPLSTSDLAAAARVSDTALQNAFHKTFGMSAGKYILASKMREAERLVNEGYLSVKEIAARLGFTSRNYFTRAYRKFFGRPPTKASGR